MGYVIIPMEEYQSLVNKANSLEEKEQLLVYRCRQYANLEEENVQLRIALKECKEELAP